MLTKEQIKIGEKYHIQVELTARSGYLAEVLVKEGAHTAESLIIRTKALLPIPAKPKHAPCRKFKKGDKVRLIEWNGRAPIMYGTNLFGMDEIVTVEEDENDEYDVLVNGKSARQMFHACHLELVTPVEEQVSFRVGDFSVNGEWCVWKNSLGKTEIISSYKIDTHPNAKEAAQTECDRLNAEHRKEQQ